jgi:hypothetical protein
MIEKRICHIRHGRAGIFDNDKRTTGLFGSFFDQGCGGSKRCSVRNKSGAIRLHAGKGEKQTSR